jgi:hypothetical protein
MLFATIGDKKFTGSPTGVIPIWEHNDHKNSHHFSQSGNTTNIGHRLPHRGPPHRGTKIILATGRPTGVLPTGEQKLIMFVALVGTVFMLAVGGGWKFCGLKFVRSVGWHRVLSLAVGVGSKCWLAQRHLVGSCRWMEVLPLEVLFEMLVGTGRARRGPRSE